MTAGDGQGFERREKGETDTEQDIGCLRIWNFETWIINRGKMT